MQRIVLHGLLDLGSNLLTCKIMFLLWKMLSKQNHVLKQQKILKIGTSLFQVRSSPGIFAYCCNLALFMCTLMCQFCLLVSWPASTAWKLMGMSAQTRASKSQFFQGGKYYLIQPFKIMHQLTPGLQEAEKLLSLCGTEAPNYLLMDKCKRTLEKAEIALPNWKLTGWGPALVQKLYGFIRGVLCPNKWILLSIRAESHPSAAEEARAGPSGQFWVWVLGSVHHPFDVSTQNPSEVPALTKEIVTFLLCPQIWI